MVFPEISTRGWKLLLELTILYRIDLQQVTLDHPMLAWNQLTMMLQHTRDNMVEIEMRLNDGASPIQD